MYFAVQAAQNRLFGVCGTHVVSMDVRAEAVVSAKRGSNTRAHKDMPEKGNAHKHTCMLRLCMQHNITAHHVVGEGQEG